MKKEKRYKCLSRNFTYYESGKTYNGSHKPKGSNFSVADRCEIFPERWELVEEKPTNEELIKEAKKRYPIGTEVKCLCGGVIEKITSHECDPTCAQMEIGDIWFSDGSAKVYNGNKWAKIILFQKTEIELLKEKYNKREEKQKKLAAKIAEAKKAESKPKDYELYLEASTNGNLYIKYTIGVQVRHLGRITSRGECYILSNKTTIENYELWREKGMEVCHEKVEWRGKRYWIAVGAMLWSTSAIYDFRTCHVPTNCEDKNIKRFKHNNRPIIF